jgi:subtilisin
MAEATRRPMIVTFKRKDQRPDRARDKVDVVRSAIASDVHFFNALELHRGTSMPPGLPRELVGYDVNQFEAPIVVAALTEAEVNALRGNPNVATVEEDAPCYALDGAPGAGTFVIEGQPTLQAETVPAGVAQIKAPAAWDSSRGKAIKVAVLDTGIDGAHPDLAPNYKGGISFVPDETSPQDFNSHGTHCAGTIAAAINDAGVIGVAPAAYLYAVKVLNRSGSGQFSWIIAGIDWCITNGIKIISLSLGGSSAPTALETMCNTAWNRGLLIVAAAGNSGPPTAGEPTSPPTAGEPTSVGFPARYANVIAVSAVDSSNVIAPFSSRGPEVELSAPGVNVLSTIPGGGYGSKSGTSMACPHVSGAAALAWGGHRYTNNVTIRRLLASTSDNLGIPDRDPLYGYGRVDAEQAATELAVPPMIVGIP